MLRLLRSAWALILLVLLHGFGPSLHETLHDHHHAAEHALADAFGCACSAHAAELELLRSGGPEGMPRATVADGEHECGLCAELQRGHGVPLPQLLALSSHALPPSAISCCVAPLRSGGGPTIPSARSPPVSASC